MTHHTVITGKLPGQTGGCIAKKYLNSTALNGNHNSHLIPTPQYPAVPVQNPYGAPSWGPPTGTSFPYYY